jgi:hypothetical protein
MLSMQYIRPITPMLCMSLLLARIVPTENLENSLIGVTFVTGVTVTGVTGCYTFYAGLYYSGGVPVYSGQLNGASTRDR